ncbi:hypothetical protein ABZW11_15185 [Nonomuraea sp. NPDC004580]|uniref:hypothetical protein n=1 Tax=Nonomuraea sp. NPDC004580 TaxID=3154552 RepID=UPI0033A6EA68
MDERMSSPERAFAYQEARYGFGGVLSALRQSGALWVNDPMAAMRAEYKPVQLAMAARIGLNIPKTTITSDPQKARAWAKDLGKPFVYKALGGIWHADQDMVRVIYTTPIQDPDKLLDPALSRTAQLFQEWIEAVVLPGDEPVGRVGLAQPENGAARTHRHGRHPREGAGVGAVTPPDGQSVTELAARLAGDLRARGRITDPQWEQALRDVPRHLFAPDVAWAVPNHESAPRGRIELATDPAAYLDAIYSDASIIIQTDDGEGDASSGKGAFTSSISAPGIVFPFLELLSPQESDRILEIGTGSGWTAGLLAWAIGQDGVTSVEVDAQVAARASANLKSAGRAPHLVVGDGLKGHPEGAPFDRVHVTAGVSDIPMAWISQTRPGGIIVMPWHPTGGLGHMLRLTVTSEKTAVGSFHGPASFMMVRSQRQGSKWNPHHAEQAGQSTTRLHPRTVATADLGARLLMAAYAPHVDWHVLEEDSTYSMLLFETTDPKASWAACDIKSGTDLGEVTQFGERRLWTEVSEAYLQWVSLGSSSHERFGLTIQPDGMKLWLDHSQGPSWDLSV